MQKQIKKALISVFYKDGLEPVIKKLSQENVEIYSTGGTLQFISSLGIACTPVESLTNYPSILGGRVKTLHPLVFGGILGKRDDASHAKDMEDYSIPEIDLVMVDLYPFEETVAQTNDESAIIEKIDIGGPSMLRAAAKNYKDVVVIGAKDDYQTLLNILDEQGAFTTLEQRRALAIKAFDVCTHYDNAISSWWHNAEHFTPFNKDKKTLRYGENPHQSATFYGNISEVFDQLNGKELSYNNLVDADAAVQLIREFNDPAFAIIKHTNVCGAAIGADVLDAWTKALMGDPESAFGGVLVTNRQVNESTAQGMNDLFFEVLIAPGYDDAALKILKTKKNRILLILKDFKATSIQSKSLLNGMLTQQNDFGNVVEWKEVGGVDCTDEQKADLSFANILCKHLKSNAIALVKEKRLLGKGCGQTSRIDALRQAIDKAKQFDAPLEDAVLASDAFFPFDDCIKLAHAAGINAFIQPGGSIRDEDSIKYAQEHGLAMVMTGMRHFKH